MSITRLPGDDARPREADRETPDDAPTRGWRAIRSPLGRVSTGRPSHMFGRVTKASPVPSPSPMGVWQRCGGNAQVPRTLQALSAASEGPSFAPGGAQGEGRRRSPRDSPVARARPVPRTSIALGATLSCPPFGGQRETGEPPRTRRSPGTAPSPAGERCRGAREGSVLRRSQKCSPDLNSRSHAENLGRRASRACRLPPAAFRVREL